MKKLIVLLSLALINVCLAAELTDESFKNSNRYELIKNHKIGETDSLNVEIKFIPPREKKVNQATFLRTWEKSKNAWLETETIEVGNVPFEFADNILLHNVILKNTNSEVALEVDFIHCDKKGGSCSSKKFLTRLVRQKSIKDNKLNFILKI